MKLLIAVALLGLASAQDIGTIQPVEENIPFPHGQDIKNEKELSEIRNKPEQK